MRAALLPLAVLAAAAGLPSAHRQLHDGKLVFTLDPPAGFSEVAEKRALLVLEQPGLARIVVRTVRKVDAAEPLESAIHTDIERFEAAHKDAKVEAPEPLPTGGDERAEVRRFSSAGGPAPAFEEVAYLDSPSAVLLLSVSARSEKEFQAGLPLFEKMVASYRRKEQ